MRLQAEDSYGDDQESERGVERHLRMGHQPDQRFCGEDVADGRDQRDEAPQEGKQLGLPWCLAREQQGRPEEREAERGVGPHPPRKARPVAWIGEQGLINPIEGCSSVFCECGEPEQQHGERRPAGDRPVRKRHGDSQQHERGSGVGLHGADMGRDRRDDRYVQRPSDENRAAEQDGQRSGDQRDPLSHPEVLGVRSSGHSVPSPLVAGVGVGSLRATPIRRGRSLSRAG